MTYPGGQHATGFFVPNARIITTVNVDNSTVLGIVAWGGFAFPMDPAAVRGHYRVLKREVAGDTLELDQNWSEEPPLDPPDFVMNIINQVGDFADFGSSGFINNSTACINIANGARWEAGIGVARSVSFSFDIVYGNAPAANTCPRDSIFATFGYTVTAVFSG